MLDDLGVAAADDLFKSIPSSVRLSRPLNIPGPVSELSLVRDMEQLARRNLAADDLVCFAGGGAYDHFIPAVVDALAGRSEFVTSYTPYQPELSQGVLGALFEYQTMICELTGMQVANSSLYDGANSLAEAVNLAVSVTGRNRVLVTQALSPNYRAVLDTLGVGLDIQTLPATLGVTELGDTSDAACVVIAQPNFFGSIEDIAPLARAAQDGGALLVVHFDPLAAGILEAPGIQGADVVTGEGQGLGNYLNYGGPYLGLFATKTEYMRRLPGRVCGATTDSEGKPGYVLTLQTREQHIRRDKATSNICTDQTLLAIRAAVYLSWLGPQGLREVGERCFALAHLAADALCAIPGCSMRFDAAFFKEFTLRVPGDASEIVFNMLSKGYLAGPAFSGLKAGGEGLEDCLMICVTEKRTEGQIKGLAKALSEALS